MTLRNKAREFVPVVLLFVIVNALAIAFRTERKGWNVDKDVLIAGNLLLFFLTFFSFLLAKRGLQHQNPNVFMRSIVGGIMIKMFVAAAVAGAYILIYKKELNKPALFICMGLYLVYTFLEVAVLTRMLRKPNE